MQTESLLDLYPINACFHFLLFPDQISRNLCIKLLCSLAERCITFSCFKGGKMIPQVTGQGKSFNIPIFYQRWRNNLGTTHFFHCVVWPQEANHSRLWASVLSSAINVFPAVPWPNRGSTASSSVLSTGFQTPQAGHIFSMSGTPHCACAHGPSALIQTGFPEPRKMGDEQKELELLPAPAMASALALLCATISPGIKWLLSQIKTQGHFKTWLLIDKLK